MLAAGFAIDQDHVEQILEATAEILDKLLLELGSSATGAGLDRRNVVLGDAEIVGQLALGQALLLARSVAGGSAP